MRNLSFHLDDLGIRLWIIIIVDMDIPFNFEQRSMKWFSCTLPTGRDPYVGRPLITAYMATWGSKEDQGARLSKYFPTSNIWVSRKGGVYKEDVSLSFVIINKVMNMQEGINRIELTHLSNAFPPWFWEIQQTLALMTCILAIEVELAWLAKQQDR